MWEFYFSAHSEGKKCALGFPRDVRLSRAVEPPLTDGVYSHWRRCAAHAHTYTHTHTQHTQHTHARTHTQIHLADTAHVTRTRPHTQHNTQHNTHTAQQKHTTHARTHTHADTPRTLHTHTHTHTHHTHVLLHTHCTRTFVHTHCTHTHTHKHTHTHTHTHCVAELRQQALPSSCTGWGGEFSTSCEGHPMETNPPTCTHACATHTHTRTHTTTHFAFSDLILSTSFPSISNSPSSFTLLPDSRPLDQKPT